MKPTILCLLLAFALSLFSGCSTTRIDRAAKTLKSTGGSLYGPRSYQDDAYRSKLQKLDPSKPCSETENAKFIYHYLDKINSDYNDYVLTLTEGKAAVDVMYDSLNLGLTGASAAFNPASTKTILAASSTFFQGQKQSLDKNLFDEKAIFALTSIMETRRSLVLKGIRTKFETPDQYTLGSAVLDLNDLYKSGTLHNALQASYLSQPQRVTKDDDSPDGDKGTPPPDGPKPAPAPPKANIPERFNAPVAFPPSTDPSLSFD